MEKIQETATELKKKGGVWRIFLSLFIFLFLFFSILLYFALQYLLQNWSELTVDEILYHIKAPMGGANGHLVHLFLLTVLLPALLLTVLSFLLYLFLKRPEKGGDGIKFPKLRCVTLFIRKHALFLFFLFGLGFFSVTIVNAWDSISLGSYLSSQISSSKFIEENYVDPKTVSLHFPEKKRNLIYIYMESTEMTFMDKAHGGAFPENLLPELTQLSEEEGEDFSGPGEKRNGGISMPGATWTMGAMFGQSTGLPLKISIEQNSMDSQEHFFPTVTALGDILAEEGYTQKFLLGSVGYFGGRELFMKDHGNVQVEDYS